MSAVDNAVALMRDETLLMKIKAVQVYTARSVVIEPLNTPNHTERMVFAKTAIYNPEQYAAQLQNIIACDPDICSTYTTGAAIPDNVLMQKMADLWTPVSLMIVGG